METIILGILIVVFIVGWLVARCFKPHMPELYKLEIDEGAKELKLFGDMAQLAAYEQLGLLPKDIILIGKGMTNFQAENIFRTKLVENAYSLGVMDVVSKPVAAVVVERCVKTVVELFSARERLRETVKGQEIELSENAKVIDELHRGTLETLATAIEFRDMESGQHVSRIYGMTKYILLHTDFGKGLSEDTIESMARASIMHDVGKIAISDVILNKPGKLTKEEFEMMKQHTIKGADLMEKIAGIQSHDSYDYAVDIARHHHERWDGRGYPDGLKGDEISVAAQVASIVDVYDALVSPRVYKAPYSHDEAVNMIKNGECGAFSPKLLECFLEAEPVIRKWYLADGADEVFIDDKYKHRQA